VAPCDLVGGLLAGRLAARGARPDTPPVLSSPAGQRVPVGTELPAKLQARIDGVAALGPFGLAEKRAADTIAPDAAPEVLDTVRQATEVFAMRGYEAAVCAC
jgi:hypothetical protein